VTSVLRRGLTRGSVAFGIAPAEDCESLQELGLTSGADPSISICDCLRFPFTVSDSTEGALEGSHMVCDMVSHSSSWLADEVVSNGIVTINGSKSAIAFCRTHSSIQPGWIAFCERRKSPSILRVSGDK
jgi:hypothetical protein